MTKNPILIGLGILNVVCMGLNILWAVQAYHNPNLPAFAPIAHIAVALINGGVAYMCFANKFPGRE